MESQPATLLRYRFDTVAQTKAHLRDGVRGTLLFFRGHELPASAPEIACTLTLVALPAGPRLPLLTLMGGRLGESLNR